VISNGEVVFQHQKQYDENDWLGGVIEKGRSQENNSIQEE
jgi:hypothetical protein